VKRAPQFGLNPEAGFTLAETLIVVTIILVVGGLSMPSLFRTIDNTRLKGATQELAAAYEHARIRSTQNNTSYQILASPAGVMPATVCIDLDGNGNCGPREPVTVLPPQVTLSNIGVPVPLNGQLTFPFVNSENSPGLAWNPRGLPCQRDPLDANSRCLAQGWVQHLQFQRASGEILYGAVTVSPTGRVKTWIFVPGNGNGQWL
jgi:type II secretory pathway pseudopilin PulG